MSWQAEPTQDGWHWVQWSKVPSTNVGGPDDGPEWIYWSRFSNRWWVKETRNPAECDDIELDGHPVWPISDPRKGGA